LPVYVLTCRKWESWKGRASVPAFFFEKFVEFSPAAHLKIQISERGKKPHSDKRTYRDLAGITIELELCYAPNYYHDAPDIYGFVWRKPSDEHKRAPSLA